MQFVFTPLRIDEQHDLLNSRGLDFSGYTKAQVIHFLSHVSYFHLQRYFYHFMERKDGKLYFTDGFSWGELITIYTDDKKAQSLLLQQLSQIEVSMVAIIVRITTSEWGSHWIYDEQYYNKKTLFYQWIQDFTTNIEFYKRRHDSIKLYYDKGYDDPSYPPVWNVMEILSLGQISKMLISLPSSMKKKIAKEHDLPSPVLCNWLEGLTQIRNIAAHNDVLYQYNGLKQLQSYRNIDLSPDKNLPEDYQKVVTYLLDIIRGGGIGNDHND